MRIYLRHVKAVNLCTRGGRGWFALHGLSWDDFVTNGIALEVVEKLDDPFANRVIEAARAEARDGQK